VGDREDDDDDDDDDDDEDDDDDDDDEVVEFVPKKTGDRYSTPKFSRKKGKKNNPTTSSRDMIDSDNEEKKKDDDEDADDSAASNLPFDPNTAFSPHFVGAPIVLQECKEVFKAYARMKKSDPNVSFTGKLFAPIWNILSKQKDKSLSWKYQRAVGSLNSQWWYASPSFEKLSTSTENVDLFKSEASVVIRVGNAIMSNPAIVRNYSDKLQQILTVVSINEGALPVDDDAPTERRSRKPSSKAAKSPSLRRASKRSLNSSGEKKQPEKESKKSRRAAKDAGGVNNGDKLSQSGASAVGALMAMGGQLAATPKPAAATPKSAAATHKPASATPVPPPQRVFGPDAQRAAEALAAHRQQQLKQQPLPPTDLVSDSQREIARILDQINDSSFPPAAPSASTILEQRFVNNFASTLFSDCAFLASSVPENVLRSITSHGGKVAPSLSSLKSKAYSNHSVFFLGEPGCWREPNYVFAIASGIPALHYRWVEAVIRRDYNYLVHAFGDETPDLGASTEDIVAKRPQLQDVDMYEPLRLPVGGNLSAKAFELQNLQRDIVKPLSGMNVCVALEDAGKEAEWCMVLEAAGATCIASDTDAGSSDWDDLDVIFVDSLSLPPHVTAAAQRVTTALKSAQLIGARVLALSFVEESIALNTRVNLLNLQERFCIKEDYKGRVFAKKMGDGNRMEVGDVVEIMESSSRTTSTISWGRIKSFNDDGESMKVVMLTKHDSALVEQEGSVLLSIKLASVCGQVMLLGAREYQEISQGWGGATQKCFVYKSKK
jgi:hypothetical protein